MPIILQSTAGRFEPDFLQQLPTLERAMEERGLDPGAIIIAKNAAQYPVPYSNISPVVSGQFDYTVFVGGESFTVTRRGDLSFLEYFTRLCLAPDRDEADESLLEHVKRWLNEKPDFL